MRYKFSGVFRDGAGNVVSGGSITVYLSGTTTLADIYTTPTGLTAVNSTTSSTDGSFSFYIEEGDYYSDHTRKLVLSRSGFTTKTYDYHEPSGLYLDDYTDSTITYSLSKIGTSTKATILIRPGTWTISTNVDWSAYTNVTFKFAYGAILSHGSYTVKITNIDAGEYQIFSGTGAVTISGYSNVGIIGELFGAVGDDPTVDSRAAFQQAINSTDKQVRVLGKVYYINKGTAHTDESGTNYACFVMKNHMHIKGDPGATFKLSDNQSSNATPLNISMFFSNEFLHDISVRGLIIDMNGANNKVNGTNVTFQHFGFSGTPGGVAAGGTDIVLENNQFINTPGVTCIGAAQSNTSSITLGKRWTVKNNLFYNNGLDSGDHSSIYAYADDFLIDGNVFTADSMATATGGQVAYEHHGARQKFVNNTVYNYYQGAWVTSNQSTECVDSIIANNTFYVSDYGVAFYRESAVESAIKRINISDNIVYLTDRATLATLKTGVQIAATYKIEDVTIENNQVYKTGTDESSAAIGFGPQSVASQAHTGIKVSGNYSRGCTFGVYGTTNANSGLGYISITGNEFYELNATTTFTAPSAIYFERLAGSTTISNLTIENNILDGSIANANYGISLISLLITNLKIGDNTYRGFVTKNVNVNSTITNYDNSYSKERLLSTTTISLAGTGVATLYTVPTGDRLVLTKALLIAGADAGTTQVSIGLSTATTDFIPTTTLSNVNAQYDVALLQPVPSTTPTATKSYAAGDIIRIEVTNHAGGATNTLMLYGVLY
jgi:hypothetical protein